ncbi:hypothetical protein [Bradyrhizobium sp. ARR65]|uniref:hypothetical protein n=1 Tax=Bradyrhizobium sp. ARR65 TaxID=1040989 RepID=UPI0006891B4D|nr:hypothetical protein [Bradyrhizobium sp. ARR65]
MLALISLLPSAGVFAEGQQPTFSDKLVIKQGNASPAPAGQLLVSAEKVRIETPDLPDGFFLIDAARPSAYFVRPAMRVYMEARQTSRLTSLFVPVDPDDPCRRWQMMAHLAGVTEHNDWHCERLGEETIGGRSAIAYRAVSGSDDQFLGWIDPLLKFPVRVQTKDGTVIATDDVREEMQPASLLELPSDFRKFDPAMLVKQIKQSDVWVEPR